MVATKLRKWASAIGQLHVGAQSDPTTRLVLEGVDLAPILEQAREQDTPGARQRMIRDLLFTAMGIDTISDWGKDTTVTWRGTKRAGHVRFGNVRRLDPDQLRCPDTDDWRLIVDYPFDDEGFGPNADVGVIEAFMSTGVGSWTLVWLPSFFSKQIRDLLGDLVVLDHLLDTSETRRRAVSHLSVENQARALVDLENLRNQKRARIGSALEQAYGLAKPKDGELDPFLSVDTHLRLLKPGAHFQPPLAASLADALNQYVPALLETRHPRHPNFEDTPLTTQRVARVFEKFGDIVDAEQKRIPAEKDLVKEMRGTLGELGLVRVTENAVHLLEDKTLQDLERKRAQKSVSAPTVGEVRAWIDEGDKMGLRPEALDLVVRCYARWAARTLVRDGRAFEAKAGQEMPDDVVLEKPELPSHTDWTKALGVVGDTFGKALPGKALHADNLKRFEALVRDDVAAALGPAAKLPNALRGRLNELGQPDTADRWRTARAADQLCAALTGKSGLGMVLALAGFEFQQTSAKAVGKSLATAAETLKVLDDALVFGVFQQLDARADEIAAARDVVARVAQSLRQDELHEALAPRLRALAEEGQRLLAPKPAAPVSKSPAPVPSAVAPAGTPPSPSQGGPGAALLSLDASSRDEALTRLREALHAVESAAPRATVSLSGSLSISLDKKP